MLFDTIDSDSAGGTSPGSGKAPASNSFSVLDTSSQIDRLSGKGIDVSHYQVAKRLVLSVGYTHLMPYVRALRSLYAGRVSADFLERAILIDRAFQRVLFGSLIVFEQNFKTRFASELAMAYGSYAHLCRAPFANAGCYEEFSSICSKERKRRSKSNPRYIMHHLNEEGNLPVWVQFDILSFGTASRAYGNLSDKAVRSGVAQAFSIDHNILESWLRSLTVVRNICAHGDILYGRQLSQVPRSIREFPANLNRAFGCVLVLSRLLAAVDTPAAHRFACGLARALCREDDALLSPLGFPSDWGESLCAAASMGGGFSQLKADAAGLFGKVA